MNIDERLVERVLEALTEGEEGEELHQLAMKAIALTPGAKTPLDVINFWADKDDGMS